MKGAHHIFNFNFAILNLIVGLAPAMEALTELETQILEFPWAEDDPVLFEAVIRLRSKAV